MYSSTLMDRVSLQTNDYVVIVLMLIIPLGIGVFFAVRDAKKATREEYLLGGRQMSMLPVMLSIFVTFQSAISLIGMPSEIYTHGPMFYGIYIGVGISFVISYFVITPLLYPLRITSIYEYFQMRYESRAVRMLSTMLGMMQTFFYLAVALLAPGLALEAAANIPLWVSVVLVGATGTIYTAVGGMKSVVWTDAFQTIIVFIGVFAVIIKSVTEVGGVAKTWDSAAADGRTNFNHFQFDLRLRNTWYGVILGGTMSWMTNLFSQSTCQRISAMKSLKQARISMLLNVPVNLIYGFVCTIVGWCMYAYLKHIQCDPFEAGIVNNKNQMTPFFVLHAMHDLPGFAGIYMSSLFSGALSTLSSGINALAANTVEDILEKPMKSVTEKTATTITKVAVFLYGAAIIGVVYLAKNIKGQVTQLAVSVFGTFGSSVLGMFLLGATIPWGNKYGAIAGSITSLVINVWLVIGGILYGKKPTPLDPVTTDHCYNSTVSAYHGIMNNNTIVGNVTEISTTILPDTEHSSGLSDTFSPYDISYEWYSVIGTVICFSVSVIVSRLTRHKVSTIPEAKLIIPCLRKFWGIETVDITVINESNGLIKEDEIELNER